LAKDLETQYPCKNPCDIVDELNKIYDGNPNYIYTQNRGWIDLNHFLGTAHYPRTPDWIPITAGWGTEIGQFLLGNTVGWFKDGLGSSAFTSEDLPSNQAGRDFSMLLNIACHGGGMKASEIIDKFFQRNNATRPEDAPDWNQLPGNETKHEQEFREKRQSYLRWLWDMYFGDEGPL